MNSRPIGVTIAAAVVLLAACLPWGVVDFSRVSDSVGSELGGMLQQMMAMMGPITVAAWNGHAKLGPIQLPNILVVFAALAAGAVSWLGALSVWKPPGWLPITLAGYGLAHSAYVLVMMVTSREASARLGVFLSVFGFAGMALATWPRPAQVIAADLPSAPQPD